MDIDTLLSKHSDNYRFHGVRGETLEELIRQSTDGQIILWGTDHDEHIDNEDGEMDVEYVQGQGYLYTTDIKSIETSYNEFCADGLVLVLEKQADEPFEYSYDRNRQHIIRAEEWRVIGGLRPTFDEDGELIDQEALSLEEIIEM